MITFEGVTHHYGDRTVLRDITCTLTERRVGIIGANGSGKSTLARMINGLVLPSEGRVLVEDLDTAHQGRRIRQQVSFLFSDPDAQIVMPTVGEDIAFSLRRFRLSHDEVRHRIEQILDRVDLVGYVDHPAHLLSSGQKQLLALASILVTQPRILIADEPTTLLDLRHTRQIAHLLDALDQQVILVTHDLDLVVGYERVLVIDEGRIIADGSGPDCVEQYRRLMGVS